ncbi:hypothetical protein PYCCODRAFT_561264 [Trametes coccinea BRFM310]|uniref:Secreted protein n=1 Tax=Trametes coccinea (strain BRFM310) TaxID=1353009 RepID=A0A1Y2ILA1_TRAC3|nr:hypothetical protein PYCCODRAFT_561264 [Trametes coccinea BRFM310]
MAPVWIAAVPWSLACVHSEHIGQGAHPLGENIRQSPPRARSKRLQGTYSAVVEPQQCKEQRGLSAEAKPMECSSFSARAAVLCRFGLRKGSVDRCTKTLNPCPSYATRMHNRRKDARRICWSQISYRYVLVHRATPSSLRVRT